jgi:regulatory protein
LEHKAVITAIKAGKNPRIQRSNLFLDGKFAFSLDNQVIVKERLKVGAQLSPAEVELLGGADHYERCLNSALRFLAYRPRSEAETQQRLKKRGYGAGEIARALVRLKELNLLDDSAFAQYWTENRDSFRPRGPRLIKTELRRKGLGREVIDQAVQGLDEKEAAYRAAMGKARVLTLADFQDFRRKLGGYLQRRGFEYGTVNATVRRVWQEKKGETSDEPIRDEEEG